MLDLVTLPNERIGIDGDPLRGRMLFAVKEAVYKAVQPLDGIFLDYHDIEVDLAGGKARTKNKRALDIRFCVATHIVAVAWIASCADVMPREGRASSCDDFRSRKDVDRPH